MVRVTSGCTWPTAALDVKVIVPTVPELSVSEELSNAPISVAPSITMFAPPEELPLLVVSNTDVPPLVPVIPTFLVEDPSVIGLPAVRMSPLMATWAVAVRPPLKVSTSLGEFPSSTRPVLEMVVALLTEVTAPKRARK